MSQGWYPDPEDPGLLRWWDGAQWTSYTVAADQSRLVNAAPAGTPPGWYADPYGVAGMLRWWTGSEWSGHTTDDGQEPEGIGGRISEWFSQSLHNPSDQELVQKYRLVGMSAPLDGGDRRGGRADTGKVLLYVFMVVIGLFVFAPGALFSVLAPLSGSQVPVATVVLALLVPVVACVATLAWTVPRWSRLTDLPTSRPLSVGAGLVEVRGTLDASSGLSQSWMSGRDAVFWHTDFEKLVSSGKSSYWKKFASTGSTSAWLVLTSADGGELLVRADQWRQLLAEAAPRTLRADSGSRCTESVLQPGEPLTVVGEVVVTPECRLELRRVHGSSVSMAEPDAYERRLLRRIRVSGGLAGVCVVACLAAGFASSPLGTAAVTAGMLAAGAALWAWWTQARAAAVRERIAGTFSLIDAFAQRRHQVVPALTAITKASADHERTVQLDTATVREARLPTADEAHAAERMLQEDSPASAALRATVEAQPQLHAVEAFDTLFRELVRCEDQLAGARTTYNEAVRIAADRLGTFPTSIVARRVIPELPPYLDWK